MDLVKVRVSNKRDQLIDFLPDHKLCPNSIYSIGKRSWRELRVQNLQEKAIAWWEAARKCQLNIMERKFGFTNGIQTVKENELVGPTNVPKEGMRKRR